MYYYNDQLTDLGDGVVTEKDMNQYTIKCISKDSIDNFKLNISTHHGTSLDKIYHIFKDKIIDALSQCSKLNSITACNDMLNMAKIREVGDVFIYPEQAHIVGQAGVDDTEGRNWGNYGTSGGLLVSVRCWITSLSCQNWALHSHRHFGAYGIDSRLPAELFLGKKEGDVVTFNFKGRYIRLHCRQLPYKYGNRKFEEAMLMCISNFGTCSPNYYTPPLSYEDQVIMFTEFKKRYLAYT
jgi:hypothetical protein